MANDAPLARSETEMHLVMTGRVASHTIGLNGATQNIDVVEIGTSTIEKAISAAGRDIDNIGMVSMDSLFCPYFIGLSWENHESLPSWKEPNSSGITSTNLNPFNPSKLMTDANIFYQAGPNLAIYNSVETLGEGDFCQFKNLVPNDQSEVSLRLDSVKAVGFKSPMVLTGWGYNTEGKPVPADTGNPNVFRNDAFRNPSGWKTGPVDLRWDDDKEMWVGFCERLQVIFSEDLMAAVNTKRDPSIAKARILRKKTNGDLKLSLDEVTVVNRFKNISIDSGVYAKIEYINGEWQPYAADCPGDSVSE